MKARQNRDISPKATHRNRRSIGWMLAVFAAGAGLFYASIRFISTVPPAQMTSAKIVRGEKIDSANPAPPVSTPATNPAPPAVLNSPGNGTPAVAGIAAPPDPPSPSVTNEAFEGYVTAGFDKLASFTFVTSTNLHRTDPWSKIKGLLPPSVLALDNRKVAVVGFMLPTRVENGSVKEFVLLRNQMACCYGIPPHFNEFVDVKPPAKGVSAIMHVPITVCGTLHLTDLRSNGSLVGIYTLDCDRLIPPK